MDQRSPVQPLGSGIDDLAEDWLQQPQGDGPVVAVLLDEIHDFQAFVGAQSLIAQPMRLDRMSSTTSSWVASSSKMSHRAEHRLEGVVPPGDDVRTEDESALEDERAGEVIQLAGPVGDDPGIAPQGRLRRSPR